MKLNIESLDLANGILRVIKATDSKNTNPILEGIKLVARDDNLTLIASNGNLSIENTIRADVKIEGECVVQGKFFCDFIKGIKNEKIDLSLNEKGQLKIIYGDSESLINCLETSEFPSIDTINQTNYLELKESSLKRLIDKVIFNCATDNIRPILKGCLFEVVGNEITSVALDGYRLGKTTEKLENEIKDLKLVIPNSSLKEINSLLECNNNLIKLYYDRNKMQVLSDNTRITTRLINGDYIDYKKIINTRFESIVEIKKELLEKSIEQGLILGKYSNNFTINFNVNEDYLKLSTIGQIGNWSENLPVSLTGHTLNINLNGNFIKECLKSIDTEYIKLNFIKSVNPCIITPNEENTLYLILPVRQM